MKAQHTPGRLTHYILDKPLADIPAYVDQCIKVSGGLDFYFLSADCPDRGQVDIAHIGNGPRGEANARRLVACWNACENIDTKVLEDFPLGVINAEHARVMIERTRQRNELAQTLARVEQKVEALILQRDELLAALKTIIVEAGGIGPEYMFDDARAAIAKATGEYQ